MDFFTKGGGPMGLMFELKSKSKGSGFFMENTPPCLIGLRDKIGFFIFTLICICWFYSNSAILTRFSQ